MKLTELHVLDDAEIEKIHSKSLTILERAGIRVFDPECRARLVGAGAKTDPGGDTVYLPRQLVEECLKLAPPEFQLFRRDGAAVRIGIDTRVFGSLIIDPWIIDFATQKPRRPLLADVVRHTRLGDALDNVGFIYRMDMPPDDVPGAQGYIRTLEAVAVNTIKPLLAAPATRESLYDWLELADILADGRPLSERPMLILSAPVTTPLTFHPLNAEILMEGIRRGLPVSAQSEPIAGTTAPLSFAGGILMGNCENLFLVTLAQILKPGAPIVYSVGNALTDFRTGHASFYPADKMLWKIASGQMARRYRLPMGGEATGSMVGLFDTQNGIEHALHMLPPVLAGGGMFNGLGSCFNACGMSPEMVMIHSDLARLCDRLRAGVEVNEKTLDVESIIELGPGGCFLEDPLTIKNLRSGEFFTEGAFSRLGERSPNRFDDSLVARAHQQVEQRLETHMPAVPNHLVAAIQRWAEQTQIRGRSG